MSESLSPRLDMHPCAYFLTGSEPAIIDCTPHQPLSYDNPSAEAPSEADSTTAPETPQSLVIEAACKAPSAAAPRAACRPSYGRVLEKRRIAHRASAAASVAARPLNSIATVFENVFSVSRQGDFLVPVDRLRAMEDAEMSGRRHPNRIYRLAFHSKLERVLWDKKTVYVDARDDAIRKEEPFGHPLAPGFPLLEVGEGAEHVLHVAVREGRKQALLAKHLVRKAVCLSLGAAPRADPPPPRPDARSRSRWRQSAAPVPAIVLKRPSLFPDADDAEPILRS
jgi:hypothetical protein